MLEQHSTAAPTQNTGATSLEELKQAFQSLNERDQQEVMEFVLLIAKRKYQHLDKNHIPRLVFAIQHNRQHIRAELQYANEKLGASYDLSQWEVSHD
ncbi:MAG: hypothetical protein IPL34_18985 [Thiofilum sp.]|uniref:hypothetical protein n=1 Tax=Thiofilum sp. TaxID=2212733 RepID=UPI0025EBFEE0|nr:hypothetical protein [Thiofilum sp.]MBK8455372.1 hypothetical protein [Thiofilum sp.]